MSWRCSWVTCGPRNRGRAGCPRTRPRALAVSGSAPGRNVADAGLDVATQSGHVDGARIPFALRAVRVLLASDRATGVLRQAAADRGAATNQRVMLWLGSVCAVWCCRARSAVGPLDADHAPVTHIGRQPRIHANAGVPCDADRGNSTSRTPSARSTSASQTGVAGPWCYLGHGLSLSPPRGDQRRCVCNGRTHRYSSEASRQRTSSANATWIATRPDPELCERRAPITPRRCTATTSTGHSSAQ